MLTEWRWSSRGSGFSATSSPRAKAEGELAQADSISIEGREVSGESPDLDAERADHAAGRRNAGTETDRDDIGSGHERHTRLKHGGETEIVADSLPAGVEVSNLHARKGR